MAVTLQAEDLPAFVPGLVLWLDAADADTVFADASGTAPAAPGGTVGRWSDKSRRGNHATGPGGGALPVRTSGGLRFDGVELLSLDPALLPVDGAPSTVFVVAGLDPTVSAPATAFAHGTAVAEGARTVGAAAARARIAGTGLTAAVTGTWPSTGLGLVSAEFDSGVAIRADGGALVRAATTLATGASAATVGSSPDGSAWSGPVAEVLVYDRILSGTERRVVERHLAASWGIPLAPAAPNGLSASASAPGAVTVAWGAPGDDDGHPVTDHVVQYRTAPSGSWTTFEDGASAATTAVVTGLMTGTTYDVRVAAVNAAGVSDWSPTASTRALAAWTPADLPGGVELWLDAAEPGTVTETGGVVRTWHDRSGNRRDATQTDDALRPSFEAAGWNGRPVVRFDGAVGGDLLTTGWSMPASHTAAFVAVRDAQTGSTASALRPVVASDTGTTFVGYGAFRTGFSPSDAVDFAVGDTRVPAVGGRWPQGAGVVAVGTYDAAVDDLRGWADGAVVGENLNLPHTAFGTVTVGGASANSARRFAGAVAEIVVTDEVLSTADRERLEGYLAHAWGTAASLPAGHPYRAVPPLTATPAGVPAAPSTPNLTTGNGELVASWPSPASNGSPIRDYTVQYRVSPSGTWTTVTDAVTAGTSTVITGLTNGTAYDVRVAAVSAAGTSPWSPPATATPLGLWTPAFLSTAVWLDASVAATVLTDDAGAVSQWQDRSGNARHAAQATATARPGRSVAARNGRDLLTFDGVDDLLDVSTTVLQGDTTHSLSYVFVPVGPGSDVGGNGYRPEVSLLSSGPDRGAFHYVRNGATGASYPYLSAWGSYEAGGSTYATGNAELIQFRAETSTWQVRRNGSLEGSGTVSGGPQNDVVGLRLAAQQSPSRRSNIALGEVLLFTDALSAESLQRVEGYLAHKWGLSASLPAGHPYRSAPPIVEVPGAPTPGTVVGSTGALTVSWAPPVDDGGTAVIDYVVQYRVSPDGAWTTFPDAVSPTPTATVTGLTDGTTYDVRIAAVNTAGTGAWSTSVSGMPAPAWTPALLSGLQLWLDAADASTVTLTGGAVSQWNDRSGNARHVSAAAPTNAPAYVTGAQNSRNVVRFDGSDDWLITPSGNTVSLPSTATVSAVARLGRDHSTYSRVLNGANDQWFYLGTDPSESVATFYGTGGSWSTVNAISARSWLQTTRMVTSVMASGSNATRVDGNAETPRSETLGSFTGRVEVGGSLNGGGNLSQLWQGDLAEVVLTSSALSTADAERLEGYYAHKWGLTGSLPAGHRYRTAGPLSVPVAPTAVSVTASHQRLDLSWSAPADDGGSAVTDYVIQYRTSPSGSWTTFGDGVSSAPAATVTGLTNGTAYEVRVAAVTARGTGLWSAGATGTPIALWTPAQLGPAVWLDAAAAGTVTFDGSGAVTEWRDRSGNNRHVSAASASARPTFAASGTGGRPSVGFDGVDDMLSVAAGGSNGVSNVSILGVFRLRAGGSSEDLPIGLGTTGATNATRLLYRSPNSTSLGWATWANDVPTSGLGLDIGGSGYHVFGGVQSSARDALLLRDGTTAAVLLPGNAIPVTSGAFSVGSLSGPSAGSYHTNMELAETVVVHRALATSERQRLEGYLAHRWGTTALLPADHPYRTAAPLVTTPAAPTVRSTTVTDGRVDLTWSAPVDDGGTAITDYVVQYRTAPSDVWTTVPDGTSTTTAASITGLTNGLAHELRVAAVSEIGPGTWWTPITVTPEPRWTPAMLIGGAALWLDADDPATLTLQSGVVAEWRDKSGNGRHVGQSTVSYRPALGTQGANGRAVVSWGSTHQGLQTTQTLTLGDFDVFAVFRDTGVTQYERIVDHDYVNGFWLGRDSGAAGSWRSGVRESALPHGRATPLTDGTWNLIQSGRSGTTATIRGNGGAPVTGTVSGATSGAQRIGIGSYANGTTSQALVNGSIAEVLLVPRALPDADRQRVEGYLAHRWGTAALLPADHPYRAAPPLAVPGTAPAPTLTAGDGRLDLTWSTPTDDGGTPITDYTVQYRTSPTGTWTTFADPVSPTTSASITGLTNSTTYDVRVAAVNARGTGTWSTPTTGTPTAPWTPADLSVAAEWWLDATTGVTAAGGTVTEWANRSTVGGSLTVPGGSTGPTVDAAAINGLSTVRFTNDLLTGPDRFGGSSENFTAVLVLRERVRSNPWFINLNGTSFANRFAFHAPWGTSWYFDAGDTGGNRSQIHGNPTAVGTVVLGTFWKDATAGRNGFRLNDGTFSAQSTGWTSAITTGGVRIGQDTADHDLAEFVAVDRRLTADEEARLEGYLAWKWGIASQLPAAHPYRNTRPMR